LHNDLQKVELNDSKPYPNPEVYISPEIPAFFIEHGSKDVIVPYLQPVHFVEELQMILGNEKVELHLLMNANHGDKAFDAKENYDKILLKVNK
jgi:dipeptidyl aminopeptidase/acylaminoacyl peptidase